MNYEERQYLIRKALGLIERLNRGRSLYITAKLDGDDILASQHQHLMTYDLDRLKECCILLRKYRIAAKIARQGTEWIL
jgi:hypothetical protein